MSNSQLTQLWADAKLEGRDDIGDQVKLLKFLETKTAEIFTMSSVYELQRQALGVKEEQIKCGTTSCDCMPSCDSSRSMQLADKPHKHHCMLSTHCASADYAVRHVHHAVHHAGAFWARR